MDIFREKAGLVTGAAGAIGEGIARQLRSGGADAAVADRDCAGNEGAAHLLGDLQDSGYANSLPTAAFHGLGGLDIVVNNPGVNTRGTPMLRTGFVKRGFDPETAVTKLGRTVPLGRIAEPEDIADVVVVFSSNAARYARRGQRRKVRKNEAV
ncbi:SDR family NAD(P)-dependent oxidoreductase [Phyllobacterium zundukense]|uniref:Short-chain dehydrogenase n=1 Tax=Phyllobacterium zundukense TaxID=1867719 RepID=A0A2N9VUS0_9HYPH|nr:SDR family NAD(P)-dependent oxidoreductase [Phyllobacterium zundukense]PIO43238.1 hypothetical protein B5P45_19365 [Phyllobacterium zundukense]